MVQIVLIRPGCTDYDQQRRIQGTLDVPLNMEGSAEVARMMDDLRGLKLEVLYASDSQPSLQTAEAIVEGLGIKLKKLDQMENLNFGLWQGMLIDEVRLKQPKVYRQWQEMPQNICPPEGEMLTEAEERVRTSMSKLLKRHKEGTIGVVVPEPLATLVRRFIVQGELGDLWKAAADHGRWELLEVTPATVGSS
ncbi:MAG: histidine phosphatase family protein [Thermoguttaceae bacterium]|jgi:probable phosphoglycerate mutase